MRENTVYLWTNRPETAYARLQSRALAEAEASGPEPHQHR